jgi:hypothetical protein
MLNAHHHFTLQSSRIDGYLTMLVKPDQGSRRFLRPQLLVPAANSMPAAVPVPAEAQAAQDCAVRQASRQGGTSLDGYVTTANRRYRAGHGVLRPKAALSLTQEKFPIQCVPGGPLSWTLGG